MAADVSTMDATVATINDLEAGGSQGNLRTSQSHILAASDVSTAMAAASMELRVLGSTEHWTQLLVVGLLVVLIAVMATLAAFSLALDDGKFSRGSARGMLEPPSSRIPEEQQLFNKAVDVPAASTPMVAKASDEMLSHTLLVRAPEGCAYIISGEISPHPQEEIVTVVNAGTNKTEARAFISETGFNPAISVETADNMAVGVLDTAAALYPENAQPPPASSRFVLVKKSDGSWFARIHAEFSSSKAKCIVQRLSGDGEPAGLLLSLHYDEKEELVHIMGPSGDIVGQPQVDRLPDGSQRRLLAVRQGADLGLILCAALAFRKLS